MGFKNISYSDLVLSYKNAKMPFGSNFDLKIVKGLYEECFKFYKGGDVLDIGAGAYKYLQKAIGIEKVKYFLG